MAHSFLQRGVAIYTGVEVKGHVPNGSTTTVSFGRGQSVTVDAVAVAVGAGP
jgi:pyruvate/2-oxoglutarate dehydrogenase complex dihydrolipoamide dehydrogenase (E3) component